LLEKEIILNWTEYVQSSKAWPVLNFIPSRFWLCIAGIVCLIMCMF